MDKMPKKQSKESSLSKEDLDKFSKELGVKISSMNKKTKGSTRIFSLRINPIFIALTAVIAFVIFFTILNSSNNNIQTKTSLDSALSNIKANVYSEVQSQNDGRVIFEGKHYSILQGKIDSEINSKRLIKDSDLSEKSLDDLIQLISPKSILEELKNAFNFQNTSVYKALVFGDNFILLQTNDNKGSIVKNKNLQNFKTRLVELGIKESDIKIPIKDLEIYGNTLAAETFSERITNGQFSQIYQINDSLVGVIPENKITQEYIDWTPLVSSFTAVLAEEQISLNPGNFKIITNNIPSGLSLNDILTILTLIGFVILGIVLFRGAQNSGMGIMQFGQSKAKMFFGSKTDITFKDVAGIDEAREELNEIVQFLRTPGKFRKLGARIPKGILMFGPPGTGKTLLARAIAGEAGVPFFHTSGSEFEEMLVGAGASRVRDLFAKAKKAAPALIFIDEIDAVARKRGTRIQSGSTEQTLNQILVEMDGFEKNSSVIVIAATNRPDVLDPAILRPGRFDRQVRIELPDKDGRLNILQLYAQDKPLEENVNLERLAKRTVGFTGADLENVLNEAAIITAKDNRKQISEKDIEEAISKTLMGPAKKSRKRSEEELKLVAYHEAGHAIIAKYTPGANPVDKISIISRGSAGGVTIMLPEKDENIISSKKLLAEIKVLLGGRAAEEVVLDDISTGASNDIERATKIARDYVQRYGMSKKLGLVKYGDDYVSGDSGYSYGDAKDYSDKTSELIDTEVREIIAEAYEYSVKTLKQNREQLDKVAKILLEKEVMDREEFEELIG